MIGDYNRYIAEVAQGEKLETANIKVQQAYEEVYANVDEGQRIPALGIEFDLNSTDHKLVTKSLLSSVRRLHVNCGHPPNEDLARIVRLSGGSEIAQRCVKGLRCTICRKA